MIKEKALSLNDLDMIWEAQVRFRKGVHSQLFNILLYLLTPSH